MKKISILNIKISFILVSLLILFNPLESEAQVLKPPKPLDTFETEDQYLEQEDPKQEEEKLTPEEREYKYPAEEAETFKGSIEYIDKLPKQKIPFAIYKLEKDFDLFENMECPPNTFKVYAYDLNKDGKKELFVSNPNNNGQYWYFWRIYEHQGNSFKRIGELSCNSIRTTNNYTDGYEDLETYSYISMAQGDLKLYKHFGKEYFMESKKIINSSEFPYK